MAKKNGKPKKRRVFASDKHNAKTRQTASGSVPSNPFDLHVNRLKHDVLGKRRNHEKGGQPLKSRSRAIEKRKRTLLKELNSVFKKNTFIDRRLGENDPTLADEEKAMQRLIAERTKIRPGKESRYNLNDEEDLTHYGQSLSKSDELNQKPVVDEFDDDEDNNGRLRSDHFFGGFDNQDRNKPKTKKEWIEDMIKSTKLDKYERQRDNEKIFDLTQTLDEQWKALSTLMGIKEKKPVESKETSDDYDKLVNSLRFEAKTTGVPTKSIEEREKEAAERLKKLQVEENSRMEKPAPKSILSRNKQQSYISVEELDESYYIMDGTKKRVTFDDEIDQDAAAVNGLNTTAVPEENGDDLKTVDNEPEAEEEEEEEMTNGNLVAEFEEIPSDIDKLQVRLSADANTLNIVWKRINDKRLPPIPKSVLSNYFDVLLEYYHSTSPTNRTGKALLHLLQLVNNEQTKTSICNRLKHYQTHLNEQIANEKFCQTETTLILFLKLIAYLYPTSDFRHPITTPAMTVLAQAINHASLNSLGSCRQALLLCELTRQWISKSRRYVPEVMLLFIKLLQLACPLNTGERFVTLSSKQIANVELLVVGKTVNLVSPVRLSFFETSDLDDNSDEHRALILQACLTCLTDFIQIYQSLSAIVEITEPFKSLLETLANTCKCSQIVSQCRELRSRIETMQKTCLNERIHLVQGKERPKTLRLFEPRFGPVFDGKKNTRAPKEYTDRLRLRQKYKREHKSAVRELVIDNQVIAREELQQQMTKDADRKRKVKDIHAQLSMQEGEYRKMQRTN